MRHRQAQTITEILAKTLRESGLDTTLMERRVVELWPSVLGAQVAKMTGAMEVKNGTLYVHIRSAVLRSELFAIRYQLMQKLNDAVGGKVLTDIRLLG